MAAGDENLTLAHHHIGFLDLATAGADGLDFPAFKHDPRLIFFFNEVIVEGLFVLNNAHEMRTLVKSGDFISF